MPSPKSILAKIKNSVKSVDPNATVILYGSRSQGSFNPLSDWDILILVDTLELTQAEERRIKYPLYEIEFDTGEIISPLVLTKSDWETKHRITPFYENVTKEGLTL